jgi:hypothetical protein
VRVFHKRLRFFTKTALVGAFFTYFVASCASLRPSAVDFGDYKPTIDTLYDRIGKMELVFCYDVDAKRRVKSLWLAPQRDNDSVSVKGIKCGGHDGVLHNHPQRLGGRYSDTTCVTSRADNNLIRYHVNVKRFVSAWCGPGRVYTMERTTDAK